MTRKAPVSAGAFILREMDGRLKIALARRKRSTKTWVLPKGHVEAGESLEQAALREIYEEAGLSHVQLLTYLGSLVREVSREGEIPPQPHKTVHYYLAYALPTGQPELPTEEGYDIAGWFEPAQILELLPYEQEKAFMREHLGRLLA
ncbi:MAG TPA: NUDIX domain-containing protein [Ktedonobacteraceae bacterium]